MNCTSGCISKNHSTYAECLRSKTVKVAYCDSVNGWDATKQKNWDSELSAYADARRQGIQPAGTTRAKIEEAVAASDRAGKAFDASIHSV